MTLSTGGFRQVVAFPPAPIATGWSDPCREGLAPSQEPCLSTAHDFITTTPELKFSVYTGSQIVKPPPARLSLSFSHSVPARRRSVPASPLPVRRMPGLRCFAPAIILRHGI